MTAPRRRLARAAGALALAAMLATGARAASSANLRWDACLGDAGASNKSFACDTNTGSNTLVGSWVSDVDVAGVVGNDIVVDIGAYAPVVPAWWDLRNPGTCRQAALSINAVAPATAVNCSDWAGGAAVVLINAYNNPGLLPGSARLLATSAVPVPMQVSAGQEYFSFQLRINNLKTVGTGACGGCDVPMCIMLKSIHLTRLPPAFDVPLFGALESSFVLWQPAPGQTMCARSVPVRNRTWGEVKSLYR